MTELFNVKDNKVKCGICKDCGEIISEKEISKERYYDDWR